MTLRRRRVNGHTAKPQGLLLGGAVCPGHEDVTIILFLSQNFSAFSEGHSPHYRQQEVLPDLNSVPLTRKGRPETLLWVTSLGPCAVPSTREKKVSREAWPLAQKQPLEPQGLKAQHDLGQSFLQPLCQLASGSWFLRTAHPSSLTFQQSAMG